MGSANAYAKLNLSLAVTGKRPDGYHTLASLVCFADITDRLSVTYADSLSLQVTGEFAALAGISEENLVLKAARLLRARAAIAQGASIVLEKNIPVGAGLGGGSADAAAALKLLCAHWKLSLSSTELFSLAAELGADVPMCLYGKPCIAEGIGENITPLMLPWQGWWVLLVFPNVPLATRDVFSRLGHPEDTAPTHPEFTNDASVIGWLQKHPNRLQRAAIALQPQVAEVLLALETLPNPPAISRMSGSGSACYGLFAHESEAKSAAQFLAPRYPEWWVKSAAILI